jgi:ABC-type transporter Mla maintaining outer membrane lipid asymmetry permease subunit MlaE
LRSHGARTWPRSAPDDCRAGHIIIAAEIATMKVEQIDALVTCRRTDEMFYPAPRSAATLVMPILVGVGDIIGIYGIWLEPNGWLNAAAYFAKHRGLS